MASEVVSAEVEAAKQGKLIQAFSTNLGTATTALGMWAAVVTVALVVIIAVIFRY